MVKVRSVESVLFSRYLCLCNVLRICNIRAIPTYRVYRLYDYITLFFEGTYTLSRKIVRNRDVSNDRIICM